MSNDNEQEQTPEVVTISLRDFKQWLTGVEEMQDDDWSPSVQQWQRIREKIDSIEEQAQAPQFVPRANPSPGYVPGQMPGSPMYGSGQNTNETVIQEQQADGGNTYTPAPRRAPPPPPNNPMFNTGGEGARTKTIDIDTSTSDYQSSFT
jgi:hypothetical protein